MKVKKPIPFTTPKRINRKPLFLKAIVGLIVTGVLIGTAVFGYTFFVQYRELTNEKNNLTLVKTQLTQELESVKAQLATVSAVMQDSSLWTFLLLILTLLAFK